MGSRLVAVACAQEHTVLYNLCNGIIVRGSNASACCSHQPELPQKVLEAIQSTSSCCNKTAIILAAKWCCKAADVKLQLPALHVATALNVTAKSGPVNLLAAHPIPQRPAADRQQVSGRAGAPAPPAAPPSPWRLVPAPHAACHGLKYVMAVLRHVSAAKPSATLEAAAPTRPG